ncbi:MAG: hypothetical protein Salg2KO_03710 [Salibacteraceae bacterium]
MSTPPDTIDEAWLKSHPSFCMMPFVHMHVSQHGTVTPCCQAPWQKELAFGDANESSLDEIWNGEAMNAFRAKMIKGQRDVRCERCYEKEASGWKTLRSITNENFKEHLDRVRSASADGRLNETNQDYRPVYYDLRFSNVCNYRCRICGPWSSSKWHKDAKGLGMTDNDSSLTQAVPDSSSLLSQFEANIENVEEVYFAGGEPMIMDEHYQMLEILVKHKKHQTRLMYNTNFSVLAHKQWDVLEFWKHFDHINLAASLDAMGPRAEILRKEQSWSGILQNLQILKDRAPHVRFMISPTVYVLNILHLTDFHKKMVLDRYITAEDFVPSLLIQPEYYNIRCLPSSIKKQIERNIHEHLNWLMDQSCENDEKMVYVKQTYTNLLEHMNHEDRTHLLPELKKRTTSLDKIRNEQLSEIMDELEFINNY